MKNKKAKKIVSTLLKILSSNNKSLTGPVRNTYFKKNIISNGAGFTLAETIVVTFISVMLAAVLLGVSMVGRSTYSRNIAYVQLQQNARFAMDKVINELEQTQSSQVIIETCPDGCDENMITFKTAQVTADPVAGTVYKDVPEEGEIKWGADGVLDKEIIYIAATAAFSDEYAGKLIRLATPVCGDGLCNGNEDCASCEVDCGICPPGPSACNKPWSLKAFLKRLFSGIAFADPPPGVLEAADFYDITVIADNVTKIKFWGYTNAGLIRDVHPDAVQITVTTSKPFLLDEEMEFSLISGVTLRN